MRVLLLLPALFCPILPAAEAVFRAGASAVDITPPRLPAIIAGGFLEGRAGTVTDRLHTRSLVLDDGTTQVALVVVDTCMMTRELIDAAKAQASRATGIPVERMLVSATHTHAAPAAMGCLGTRQDTAYAAFLAPKIAEGIVQAHQRLQPARIGWGAVEAAQHTHTRRWIRRPDRRITDPFGEPSARANMHPGHESPDVTGPSGPSDPGLSVLSVQTAAGKPLAFFANYSMHYFGAKAVSADYYGAFARAVARRLGQSGSEGPEFVAAMSQGTSGDQQWMDYSRPRPAIDLDTYAAEVAEQALRAHAQIRHQAHVPIAMTEKRLTLRYRVPDDQRLAWARPIAAKIENDLPKDKTEVYAREALILQERQQTEIKLQALRLGELAITALPNEVYAITGLKLKAQSPLPATFNIELANGAEGYIPPPEQHELGGYTTWPARTAGLEVQAEPKMVETLLGALEEITGRKRRPLPRERGAYAEAVLAAKPLGYWRLDEIAGHVARAETGADAAYEPGIARYLDGPPGAAFSGVQRNRAPHLAGGRLKGLPVPKGDFSVEGWVWNALPSDARPVTGYLFSRGPDGVKHCPGEHLGIGGTHHGEQAGCLFVFNGDAANATLRGKTRLGLKQWHHIVMTRSGAAVRVYLDGQLEIEGELPAPRSAEDALFAGGRSDGFANFEGKLDEVALYDRALAAAEVAEHHRLAALPAPKLQTATPPLGPEASMKKWHLREGWKIELVAAEPTVLDPVAFDWDSQGRLWVVEMADYPLGLDGKGRAGGRLVRLEDRDRDGRYEQRTVIATGLSFPTGVLCWRDGALVTAAPDLLFVAADGRKEVLYTGFSTGNEQLRVNGLRWGMDGWVYCAAGGHHGNYNKDTRITCVKTGEKVALGARDFRFRPDTGEFDPQTGPAQFGRARDDWGHWFGVQNSFPLWHYVLQDHYLRRNPHVIPPDPVQQLFPRNPPVYPVSASEKRFHSFDQAGRFTSACGIEIVRDPALFGDGRQHAFTCEPFHNVVQHHLLADEGFSFKAARDPSEAKHDFLASEDRWCRPVMVRTGPDGALWVADMYRYMIEHPQWLPQNGKDELLPFYREGEDKGRIYRVVRQAGKTVPVAQALAPLSAARGDAAVQALASANGWIRDRAQMQLAWGASAVGLEALLEHPAAEVRAQAAWALLAAGRLTPAASLKLLADASPRVREQALLLAEQLPALRQGAEAALARALAGLANDTDAKVRLQLACSLGAFGSAGAADVLADLLASAPDGSALQGAAMSSALPHLQRLCERVVQGGEPEAGASLALLFRCALSARHEGALTALAPALALPAHLSAILTVLDEQNLSLTDLGGRVAAPAFQAAVARARAVLAQDVEAVRRAGADVPLYALERLSRSREHRPLVAERLPDLWRQAPEGGQPALLGLIARLQPADGPEFLLAGWARRTPAQRGPILDTLLSSEAWTLALLDRIRSGELAASACDAAMRARLLQHPRPQVRQLAQSLLAQATPARAAVLAKFKPALQLTGRPGEGRAVFVQICASCHLLDGVGIPLGPDLRSVVRHDAEKLFNSILDPSAIIEPGFTAYHCTLKSGEQLYGVIATETASSLTLKLPGNVTRALLRSEIASLQSTQASLMPEGLEAALTPQALADLIAWLRQPH